MRLGEEISSSLGQVGESSLHLSAPQRLGSRRLGHVGKSGERGIGTQDTGYFEPRRGPGFRDQDVGFLAPNIVVRLEIACIPNTYPGY
jgi:hypothetical protein